MTARPMERPTKVRDVFRPHCARTCPCSPAFAVNPERGLLEEAGRAVLTWDAAWDQWTPQRQVNQWLARLRGDQAAAAARALREHHHAARPFAELADDHPVAEGIPRYCSRVWSSWTSYQPLTRLTGTASFAVAAPRSRPLQYGPAGSGSVSHCSNISARPPRAAG